MLACSACFFNVSLHASELSSTSGALDCECALPINWGMIIRFAAVFVGVLFLIFLAPNVLSEVLDGDFSNLAQAF